MSNAHYISDDRVCNVYCNNFQYIITYNSWEGGQKAKLEIDKNKIGVLDLKWVQTNR